jgi:hypothetical protein
MVARNVGFAVAFSLIAAARADAQDPSAQSMPNPQAMQMQVQRIAQERPREAEAAARAFLHLISMQRGHGSEGSKVAVLESLKACDLDAYWREVAQLTVQFDVVQNLVRRDSMRAGLVTQMFGLELMARTLQRAYRDATETQRDGFRSQLEKVIYAHFDFENQLRVLEIKDIERRLAEVRAETARRVEKRSEFVKWTVDDIVRDALRPQ